MANVAHRDTKTSLEELGFSKKESAVYLALISLGKGTVSQIARRAGILRTTGYDILNSLAGMGVARISGKEPKQEYVAESPETLLDVIKNRIKEEDRRLTKAQRLVPQLRSMHAVGNRPKVRFYEGEEGLAQVYEDTLTSSEAIRAYATVDDMHRALPGYFPEYYKRRSEKGISIRAIVPRTKEGLERAGKDAEEARETALIPPETFYFSPEINIYDDKVMIASWREKLGIIIESEEIADAMKKIYELAWSEAKRLHRSCE
jgi:HTH-type transcriptional regulator, sugar sensing transcriptional regulator